MKIQANNIKVLTDDGGAVNVMLTVASSPYKVKDEVPKLKEILAKGKQLDVEIKQYREKRSLDANAYLWVLLQKMAEAIGKTDKDRIYLDMLGRYGVFTHVIVKPSVVERFKQEYRLVKELGEVTVNGQTGIQLQCYFGSSTYDTKEMSVLIDGVVDECKNLGIETLTPEQLALLKEGWANENTA